MDNINALILFVSLILLFCIAFSRFLTKAGIPVLVFFILAGMIMGSDGIGGIYFDNAAVASTIGNFAICYILFAGGMATSWKSAREVLVPGVLLSTVGVIITAVLVGVAAYLLVG
ncbi:cation:proton antiporter, partial [Cloacibacillus porcorum]